MSLNSDILDEDPGSLAVEADDEVTYQPESDSNVVVTEPMIITKGRAERKRVVRNLSDEQS